MTTRPGDLGETRELLRERVRESGRVLLSAGDVQTALGVDHKTLRHYGDLGLIEYVAKGRKARAYTIEAVMDFIAGNGMARRQETCPSTSRAASATTASISSCEVIAFTARPGARPARPPRSSSARRKPGPVKR